MKRITVVLTAAAIAAATLGMAAPAQGATVVTSTSAGLSVTGDDGRNQLGLSLQVGSGGLEWTVHETCPFLCSVQPGAGCRQGSDSVTVICDRVVRGAAVALGRGNDNFTVNDNVSVIDPLTVNGQTGDDSIKGAAGPDNLQGGSGDDTVLGASGNDTVLGSIGTDLLDGEAGNDALDGGDGNDTLIPNLGADMVEGQAGDDTILLGTDVKDEKDTVNGGIGRDLASYAPASFTGGRVPDPVPGRATAVRIVEANLETLAGAKDFSEGDVLRSIENYRGGRDEDILTGVLSSNDSFYFGDADDDFIFGSSGPNTIVGGAGVDELSAKAGDDTIDAKTGETSTGAHIDRVIDCGEGDDEAFIDLKDPQPVNCEFKERSAIGEGPHVRLHAPRRTAVAGGRAAFRLSCPRKLKQSACTGKLRLKLGRASSSSTSYSIRRGRSKRVAVSLGSLNQRVGARTKAALVSVERGRLGLKTTERPVVLSG